jgi:PAS domain S-box-containing protein
MKRIVFDGNNYSENSKNMEVIRFMLDNFQDAIILTKWLNNDNIPIIKTNQVACKYLGFNPEELLQKNIFDIFTKESRPLAKRNLDTSRKISNDFWESELLTKDGKNLPVEINFYLFDIEESPMLLIRMRDTSAYTYSVNKLNTYCKLLAKAESLLKIGYWEYDVKAKKFRGSLAARSIFGLNENELSNRELEKILMREYRPVIEELLNGLNVLNEKYDIKFCIKRPADSVVIDIHTIAEYDIFNQKIYGLIQNITEQNNLHQELIIANEKAEESDRLKTEFLRNMSHEIRTPMNGIIGFSKILIQEELHPETRLEYGEMLNQSCNRLLNVITEILDISILETEPVRLQKKQINIAELLNEILIAYNPLASKKNLTILLDPKKMYKELEVITDESMLKKVLSNLVDNAIRFTSKGIIEFGCVKKDFFLEFYVKDTGIGISPSNYKIIFEKFRQAEPEIAQNYGGAGLGLAISKSFVSKLGGTIWVKSKLGEGSTFYFSIPNNLNISIMKQSNLSENAILNNELKTCLIADDIEMNYIYLKALLKPAGYNVIWAKNGDEAIDMALNGSVDIVLMDIEMPRKNGYEATRIIKSRQPNLPIIAQTAHALMDERKRVLEAGCDDYISKPILKDEFLRKIELLLNKLN